MSTVGRVELGDVVLPGQKTVKIIDALEPTSSERKQLLEAFENASVSSREEIGTHSTGKVLSEMMSDYGDISAEVLAEKLGKSRTAIWFWMNGKKQIPDAIFPRMLRELLKLGVPQTKVKELTASYVYDSIVKSPRLSFLPLSQRKQMAEFATKIVAESA